MYVVLLPIFFGLAAFALVAVNQPDPGLEQKRKGQAELTRYRVFVSTADTFFKTASAPAVISTYRWNDIKSAAPSGFAAADFRPDWRAVRAPDGTWAACTPLSEISVAMVNDIFATAAAAPASGASAAGGLLGNRIMPAALDSGGSGSLQLAGGGVSGLIAVGTPTEALAASNLCDQ